MGLIIGAIFTLKFTSKDYCPFGIDDLYSYDGNTGRIVSEYYHNNYPKYCSVMGWPLKAQFSPYKIPLATGIQRTLDDQARWFNLSGDLLLWILVVFIVLSIVRYFRMKIAERY